MSGWFAWLANCVPGTVGLYRPTVRVAELAMDLAGAAHG